MATPSAGTPITDGRVPGIDGMLDQCAEAFVRQVSRDKELQERVGAAAGRAAATTVLGAFMLGAFAKWAWDRLPDR